MNPGHLGSCGFCLLFSVFINLCLSRFYSLSLSSSSLFLSLFSSSVLTSCLLLSPPPFLKNDSAHLDRALYGRYTISPRVELIKNRSESELVKTFLLLWPPLVTNGYKIEGEKLAAKYPSLTLFFFFSLLRLCVFVSKYWVFVGEYVYRPRTSSLGAVSCRAVYLRGLSR